MQTGRWLWCLLPGGSYGGEVPSGRGSLTRLSSRYPTRRCLGVLGGLWDPLTTHTSSRVGALVWVMRSRSSLTTNCCGRTLALLRLNAILILECGTLTPHSRGQHFAFGICGWVALIAP